ncbi:hypothetical protein AB0H51_27990 [Streptomyces griseoluteus]|uniref:hypothetical protein n=1 Tax=Streptomyces griseoluteus TaxID=29306 RepID=UPI00340A616E
MSDTAPDTTAPPEEPDGTPVPAPRSRESLEAEVVALRGEVARLRAGEEPVGPHDPLTTGGHLLWVLGHVTAEMRQHLAGLLIRSMRAASECAELNHATTIAVYRERSDAYGKVVAHARAEAERLQRTEGPEGRAAAMALAYALLPEVG